MSGVEEEIELRRRKEWEAGMEWRRMMICSRAESWTRDQVGLSGSGSGQLGLNLVSVPVMRSLTWLGCLRARQEPALPDVAAAPAYARERPAAL